MLNISVRVEYFEENGQMVALCPELNVSSFGSTLAEAEQAIREAITLFLEECKRMGTLEVVLEESGFIQTNEGWRHRIPIALKPS